MTLAQAALAWLDPISMCELRVPLTGAPWWALMKAAEHR
jgi:hypothetical protein